MIGELRKVLKPLHYPLEFMLVCACWYAAYPLGLKDYELIAYFAMFAPAGTPPDIVARLNQAINAAAQSKDIQEKFAAIGFAVEPGTPEALAQRTKTETAKWAKAIADAKIEPQ